MKKRMDGWVGGWVGWWVGGWIEGWIDGCKDEVMELRKCMRVCALTLICKCARASL